MITTLIICLTVVFCVVWITLWIKHMVTRNLPMFTYGECIWKEEPAYTPVETPIGFQVPEKTDEEKTPDQTKKEQKEAVFADPVTMTAALLRGEVDIDDITINN